jgi:hypothetical protein
MSHVGLETRTAADASLLLATVTVLLQALCHHCQAINMRLKISNSAAHCCPLPPQSNFNDFPLAQIGQKHGTG